METILQYIPAVLSAILLAVLILMVITNIIVEVVKKLTWDKVPTNLLAFIVGHGRDPAGVFHRVPDPGRPHCLVHGGRRHRPGLFRGLCGHVWVG